MIGDGWSSSNLVMEAMFTLLKIQVFHQEEQLNVFLCQNCPTRNSSSVNPHIILITKTGHNFNLITNGFNVSLFGDIYFEFSFQYECDNYWKMDDLGDSMRETLNTSMTSQEERPHIYIHTTYIN